MINEVRKNPISGTIAIISTIRRLRPKQYGSKKTINVCPFCPGNEHLTPPATAVLVKRSGEHIVEHDSDDKRVTGWSARIFPNKYPALTTNPPAVTEPGFAEAYGYHEVLVETPRHVPDIHLAPCEEIADALWLGFYRIREMLRDPKVQSAIMIKNRGPLAGASIVHTHSQIFALPIIPPRIRMEIETFRYGTKPLCRYLEEELVKEKRVIYNGECLNALAIVAPRLPYEIWIVPHRHSPRPFDLNHEELLELAMVLQNVIRVYIDILRFDSYNLWLHMAPKGVDEFHWHIELAPSLPTWGGLERSSDAYIIEVPPEEVAETFKKHFTPIRGGEGS